jgi:hypothetical protein
MSSKSTNKVLGWAYHFERRGRGAAEGRHLPSVRELLAGMDFHRLSLTIDAQTWSERLLMRLERRADFERSVDLKTALKRLTVSPDVTDFLFAATVMRDEDRFQKSWLTRFDGQLRCVVYAAAAGDRDSIITVMREIRKHIPQNVSDVEEMQACMTMLLILLGKLDDIECRHTNLGQARTQRNLAYGADRIIDRMIAGAGKAKRQADLSAAAETKEAEPRMKADIAQNAPGLVVFNKIGNEVFSDNDRLKKTLEPLVGKRLPLVPLPCLRHVRTVLLHEFPYAALVIDAIISDLVPRSFVALRPTILAGLPGCGKTTFAMRLAELLGAPMTLYGCAGISDSSFAGTARRWSSGEPALPVATIISAQVANPIFVLDEIEKAGTSRHNGNLCDSLLPMLEPRSAACYFDVFIQSEVNLSAIVWIATSNDPALLPRPLRDRCRVLAFPSPAVEHLPTLARSILTHIIVDRGLDLRWVEELSGEELSALANAWPGGSLRGLQRLIEGVLATRDALAGVH